jgi:hypothetical protein
MLFRWLQAEIAYQAIGSVIWVTFKPLRLERVKSRSASVARPTTSETVSHILLAYVDDNPKLRYPCAISQLSCQACASRGSCGGNGKDSETWCWTFYLHLFEKDRKSDQGDGQ